MTGELERAREDVRRASDLTEDGTVREQLRSIDDGLMEMTHSSEEAGEGSATTAGEVPHGDELEQVEAKLAALVDDVDGRARSRIQDARDRLDVYRQEYTRDW